MKYIKNNKYLEIELDEKFNSFSIQALFNYYHLSKRQIHELRMSNDVYVNDERVFQYFNKLLKTGDKLKFPVFINEEIDFIPQEMKLDIVYEDDFLLVINKGVGIEVHPDSHAGVNTLVNGVSHYYIQTNQKHRVRYIHRLDRDTTGAIVFVKNQFVHSLFDYLLNNKEIKRYYLAVVENNPVKSNGIIEEPIGKDRHHNNKRIVSKTGEHAKTSYRVIKTNKKYSLLELELFTGKTHQIRVHMSYINCPIIGDSLYNKPSPLINRQALHAYKISLLHPVTFESFTIDIPLPDDMNNLIKNL